MRVAIFDTSLNWQKRYIRELEGIEVVFPLSHENFKQLLKQGEPFNAVATNDANFLDSLKQTYPKLKTIYVGVSQGQSSRFDRATQKGHFTTRRSGISDIIKSIPK